MAHHAGFVNIIGNPNAGKSTLVNKLMGLTMHATNAKAQTTRHRIFAILNEENYQLILSDTPGIIDPHYKLQESMVHAVEQSLQDADVFLLIVTPEERKLNNEKLIAKIQNIDQPIILGINKIDISDQNKLEASFDFWQKELPNARILPISATEQFNIEDLKKLLISALPEHPPYYSKEEISNKTTRFFVEEFIRETALELYEQEVPYAIEVYVRDFKKGKNVTRINSDIIIERDSQKKIIIGHKGKMIKKLGARSRHKIENFIDDKIFLELHVKVDKDWRRDDQKLKKYGYLNK